MIKVLFIAYHFPPIGGAGVQRSLKFVQQLPSEGFLPIVVTGPGAVGDRWAPTDATLAEAIPSDVKVHRSEGPIPDSNGKLCGRLDRWLILPSTFSKWWRESAIATACREIDGARLIFATMSPFESAEVASEVSRRTGIPWVADLRDPWALDEMQVYPTGLHRSLEMVRMENTLSTAAMIVMNTPEAAVALRSSFPRLRQKKIVAITNGFDSEDLAAKVHPRTDSKFRIVHTGYLHTELGLQLRKRSIQRLLGGAERGLDVLTRSHVILLEAVKRWCTEQTDVLQDLEIVFAGQVSEADRAKALHGEFSSVVRFTGYLSHADSLQLVRTADLLFLPMHNLPHGKRARIVPGKAYEYMASGRPILAAVPDGDARDFLNQSGNAFVCRPDDIQAMMQILSHTHERWKNKQKDGTMNTDFVQRFERRNLTRELANAFRAVLNVEEAKPRSARLAPHTA
jgi:glycosyltransferase involved in cell wall biosynthesis